LTRIDAGLDFRWRHWWLETHFRTRTELPGHLSADRTRLAPVVRELGLHNRKGITSRWWTGNTRSLAASILDIVERRLSYRDLMGFSMNWRKWK
jgi:hypothetical protein